MNEVCVYKSSIYTDISFALLTFKLYIAEANEDELVAFVSSSLVAVFFFFFWLVFLFQALHIVFNHPSCAEP